MEKLFAARQTKWDGIIDEIETMNANLPKTPPWSWDKNMLWALHQIQSLRLAKLEEQLAIRQSSTLASITDQPVASSKKSRHNHLVYGGRSKSTSKALNPSSLSTFIPMDHHDTKTTDSLSPSPKHHRHRRRRCTRSHYRNAAFSSAIRYLKDQCQPRASAGVTIIFRYPCRMDVPPKCSSGTVLRR